MTEPFVQIPRSLFDAITREKLPGSETRIVLYLIGQSIGWQRSETATFGSISAISAGAGCGRRTTIQGLASLCSRGLVVCVHRGGPGKGPSSYSLAPASEWARTSEQGCTTETHPASEQVRPSEQTRPSEQVRTTCSEQVRTTGSEQECTLYKKKKIRVKEHQPQSPLKSAAWLEDIRSIEDEPSAEGRIDIADLRQRLGMRISIADVARPKWIGISQQDPARVEELLAWAAGTADPASAFAACFDSDGKPKAKRRAKQSGTETPEEKSKRHEAMAERIKKRLAARAALT